MSFPSNLTQSADIGQFGIIVGIHPSSDTSFDITLQRQDTGTTWGRLQRWSGGSYDGVIQYRDLLPNDYKRRDYRCRHERTGYTAGAWTATVSGGPTILTDGDAPQLPITTRPLELPIRLTTGVSLALHTTSGSTAYITKTLRLGGTFFQAQNSASVGTWSQGLLKPSVGIAGDFFEGQFTLPVGVTVRSARLRGKKVTSSGICSLDLRKISTGGTVTTVVTLALTTTSTGFQTKSSSTFSPQTVANEVWYGDLTMVSTAANQTFFMYLEVDYSMPDYAKSL